MLNPEAVTSSGNAALDQGHANDNEGGNEDAGSGPASWQKKVDRNNMRKAKHFSATVEYWERSHEIPFPDLVPEGSIYSDQPPPKFVTANGNVQPINTAFHVNLLACWMVKEGLITDVSPTKKRFMLNRYNEHCWRKSTVAQLRENAPKKVRPNSLIVMQRMAKVARDTPLDRGGITQEDYLLVKHNKAKIHLAEGKYIITLKEAAAAAGAAVATFSGSIGYANCLLIEDPAIEPAKPAFFLSMIPVMGYGSTCTWLFILFFIIGALLTYWAHYRSCKNSYRKIQSIIEARKSTSMEDGSPAVNDIDYWERRYNIEEGKRE